MKIPRDGFLRLVRRLLLPIWFLIPYFAQTSLPSQQTQGMSREARNAAGEGARAPHRFASREKYDFNFLGAAFLHKTFAESW